jgi:hypothetical protein
MEEGGPRQEVEVSLVKGRGRRHLFKVPLILGSFPSQILSLSDCPLMGLPHSTPARAGGGGRSKGRCPTGNLRCSLCLDPREAPWRQDGWEPWPGVGRGGGGQ